MIHRGQYLENIAFEIVNQFLAAPEHVDNHQFATGGGVRSSPQSDPTSAVSACHWRYSRLFKRRSIPGSPASIAASAAAAAARSTISSKHRCALILPACADSQSTPSTPSLLLPAPPASPPPSLPRPPALDT